MAVHFGLRTPEHIPSPLQHIVEVGLHLERIRLTTIFTTTEMDHHLEDVACNPLQYGPNLYSNPLPFSDYPHHRVWVIHADYSISSTERTPLSQQADSDTTAESTPSDIFAFLPPWLFFGVANDILEIVVFSIDNSHFVDTDSTGGSVVTTERLRGYTWYQLPRHREALAKLCHRLNAVIVGKFSDALFYFILTQPHISNGEWDAVPLMTSGVGMLTKMLHHPHNATEYNHPEAFYVRSKETIANQTGNLGWCPNQTATLANISDITACFCLGSFVHDSAVTSDITDCSSFVVVSAHLLADIAAQEGFTSECLVAVPYYQYYLHDWTMWVAPYGVQCMPDGPALPYGMVSSIHSIVIVSLDLGVPVVKQDKVTMKSKALIIGPVFRSLYLVGIHSENFWGHLHIVQHTKMHTVKTNTQIQMDDGANNLMVVCYTFVSFGIADFFQHRLAIFVLFLNAGVTGHLCWALEMF